MAWRRNSNKYRNVPTVVEGRRFASKKEAREYLKLRALENAGKVRSLETQVPYDLVVNGTKICRYVADFVYLDVDKGITVVADAKGVRTKDYRIKAKLMKAILGIEILEL